MTMHYCSAPGCRQYPSALRTDGLCFGHGKEADGLLSLTEPRTCGRPPSQCPSKAKREAGRRWVQLPTYPGRG
jgi:hypothetical protein